jgi:crotonobetainyl-CoA:carnitine CoA-transferase CaiB-like acyl-CoA transferase
VRTLIWNFYAELKRYRINPTPRHRRALRARFDRIFRRRTGFATLDRLLARLHANKADLLRVLERPEVPLHTNGSETTSAARSHAARSVPEPAAILAAIAAMSSPAWPKPAPNMPSRSGTISAAGSASPAPHSSHHCRTWSDVGASRPDAAARPGFCRCYLISP